MGVLHAYSLHLRAGSQGLGLGKAQTPQSMRVAGLGV